jgi:hypothetical protein
MAGTRILLYAATAFFLLLAGTLPSNALIRVEPGNGSMSQPAIPGASKNRTRAFKTTFERKYEKVLGLLRRDRKLISNIKKTSAMFDIDPIHLIGAIVGEHTYNVDAYDRAQTYYVKAISYLKGSINFEYDGEAIEDFVLRPEFGTCQDLKASRPLWTCRETVWKKRFRGKKVDGTTFPNDRFSAVFFQPFYAGQTFGLGQLNPLTALMMTDRVNEVTGARKLTAKNGKRVYRAIMDPDETLPYIAATLAAAIDDYRDIAGFDISANPGLTATLYNTGDSAARARALASKNKKNGRVVLPAVNYYGWLINDKEEELRSLLDR